MQQELNTEKKKRLYTWIWKPFLYSLIVGIFIIWINGIFSFNDSGVIITALAGSFILIVPSYFMIRFLSAKHKVLKKFFVFLVVFIGIPMVGYYADTSVIFRSNMLKDAVIYNGSMPEPQAVVLSTGEIATWFLGQVNIFAKPGTNVKEVEKLIASIKGTILTKIPEFGFYLVEIKDNFEDSIIKLEEKEFVLDVAPNFMIVPAGDDIVDLTDSNIDSKELTASFLKSPGSESGIITVQIDIFKGGHGGQVNGVREAAGAKGPVLQIDVGGVKCGESFCSSADRVYSSLAAVLAGAELNRKKVVLNISLAVMPLTKDPAIFSKNNEPGSNSWATTQWESFAQGILNIVETSSWMKKGNVIIGQPAGNGACLLGKNNSVLDCAGIDITDLMVLNFDENNINIYGVEEKGKPADYSNFGKGVIMKELSKGSRGTSMSAAQGWAETEKVWTANPRLDSKKIRTKLTTVVCPGGLQVCVNSCIPTNAECCNGNRYCLKPTGSCFTQSIDLGKCHTCPVGQKFCGMFCVDVTRECQKEVVEEESSSVASQKASDQNTLECNGKKWGACPAGEKFHCPAKGDPYCATKDQILCNGDYWDGCKADEDFQCFPEGARCTPKGVTLTPLCRGERGLPCGLGYHFVCDELSGGRCDPDMPKESQPQEPVQQPQPTQQPSDFIDYNACTRNFNVCRTSCEQKKDTCDNLCPTGAGSGYDQCSGICSYEYADCSGGCDLTLNKCYYPNK